jgi:hypothetical protein
MEIKYFHRHKSVREEDILPAIEEAPEGFFIAQFEVEANRLENGLYGPASGDSPVEEEEVTYLQRSEDRPYADRMIGRPVRLVNYGQVIGMKNEDGSVLVYTCYGGPLAPQHPEDPSNGDPEKSREFWSKHAISIHAS